jgi:predicted NAD-dependent protein-ADP-ribosyltransferase YbiA (DUF1768 family)
MEISSGGKYPANSLSNFAPHPFVFEGIECKSMEGFLQSLKFKDANAQKEVCKLVGRAAKAKGQGKKWWKEQKLFWQGTEYNRSSQEYQDLLDRVYNALFEQNEGFRKALKASNGATFTHSKGKTNQRETVLTRREFCGQLARLREKVER